jgi:hypothetical protein
MKYCGKKERKKTDETLITLYWYEISRQKKKEITIIILNKSIKLM